MKKYLIVKKHVDEMDYYELLSSHAPKDEFDIESAKISERITKSHSAKDIAQIIAEVFNKFFNRNDDHDIFTECAIKIYNDLHK